MHVISARMMTAIAKATIVTATTFGSASFALAASKCDPNRLMAFHESLESTLQSMEASLPGLPPDVRNAFERDWNQAIQREGNTQPTQSERQSNVKQGAALVRRPYFYAWQAELALSDARTELSKLRKLEPSSSIGERLRASWRIPASLREAHNEWHEYVQMEAGPRVTSDQTRSIAYGVAFTVGMLEAEISCLVDSVP